MTAKFTSGRALKGIRNLIAGLPVEYQRDIEEMGKSFLWRNEFKLVRLTDTPSDYDAGEYLQSTASGAQWATIPVGDTLNRCMATDPSGWTGQTGAANWDDLEFDTEVYDQGGIFDGDKLFIPDADGIYLILFDGYFENSVATVDVCKLRFYDNTASATVAEVWSENDIGAHITATLGGKWYWYSHISVIRELTKDHQYSFDFIGIDATGGKTVYGHDFVASLRELVTT